MPGVITAVKRTKGSGRNLSDEDLKGGFLRKRSWERVKEKLKVLNRGNTGWGKCQFPSKNGEEKVRIRHGEKGKGKLTCTAAGRVTHEKSSGKVAI